MLDTNLVTCTQDFAFVDETSTIKVHEEPILDFSDLPSSRPTVLQQPPTPVPLDDAGLADSLLDTTLDGVDRTINGGQADSDSEEDSVTSTGGGSFSSGEQQSNSDEEEPGVTTQKPGTPHPSQSMITHANPTPEYSVHHRMRKKAKAVPSQEPLTSQRSKKEIPPQRLIESLSAQVKKCPIFLNVMIIVDNGPTKMQ